MPPPLRRDVFLVLKNLAQRIVSYRELTLRLECLFLEDEVPPATLFHRVDNDTALLGLALDPLTGATVLDRVRSVASDAGAAMLDAFALPDAERESFYADYLRLYPTRIVGTGAPVAALRALEEELGLLDRVPTASRPPRASTAPSTPPPPRLEVRFRRGDTWLLGHLRALAPEGALVATSNPPRAGDRVELELGLAGDASSTLLVPASILRVTAPEAASALGAAGFRAGFDLEDADADAIRGLLARAAREPAPLPRRTEMRYALRWPILIARGAAATTGFALDISRHGLFVHCDASASPTPVALTVPLDDDGGPLRLTARVARALDRGTADARQIAHGLGLTFEPPGGADGERFRSFVDRVALRTAKFVLVAASERRSLELEEELAAAGYATGAAHTPRELLDRIEFARAPDLVLLDPSLTGLAVNAGRALRRSLEIRKVPVLELEACPLDAVRQAADAALIARERPTPVWS